MTINDFINESLCRSSDRIIIIGTTKNSICHEIHKMFDSRNPRCKDGIPDCVKDETIDSIWREKDGSIILSFVTEKVLHNYL